MRPEQLSPASPFSKRPLDARRARPVTGTLEWPGHDRADANRPPMALERKLDLNIIYPLLRFFRPTPR